ncbi:hypothetical protein QYE76_010437 [Lolium multiflorum]|uniref:Retrotransposon gag domain-containing protein n=1 Tax=Lolium multiflorum TaxID=4521 RepID=A0AAD8X333_LOLMU|nr:hypothetical protein QYE76_010437 [Lolium multiflorum]
MAREFEALALNGHNYPTWAMDTKIALASRGIVRAIQAEQDPLPAGVTPLTEEQKYTALYIIRHHIHPDLKSEYLEEESPSTLFQALKTRYEQQKAVVLPEALHDWTHLRLQDFKSIGEYNHEVHKISSKLRFCGKEPTDAEKIEKTLSTMLPSDRILQQQYRARDYQVYSDLIHILLQAEKHDELLAKNGSQRPVGSQPLPEFHMNVATGRKFDGGFKGKPSNFNGIAMDEVRKKLFSISLSGKAAHWYKLLKNRDSLDWEDIVPLFYSKFYPPSEIHKDRNRIYNFWPHDGESIAQAWGRLKSLMLKCPIHELPGNVIIDNFYARLSFQDKTLLDTSCSGSFTRNKEEFKRDLLDRIQENTEGWENDKDRESVIETVDHVIPEAYIEKTPFPAKMKEYSVISSAVSKSEKKPIEHEEQIKVEPAVAIVKDLVTENVEDGHIIFCEDASNIVSHPNKSRKTSVPMLSVRIGDHCYYGLCDIGASISAIPYELYTEIMHEIGSCELEDIDVVIRLANRETISPIGIVRDVEALCGKIKYPADFLVLGSAASKYCPIIFGRPFLNTCGAVIDCKKEKIVTKFAGESYEFNFSKFAKTPYKADLPNNDFRVEQCASIALAPTNPLQQHLENSESEVFREERNELDEIFLRQPILKHDLPVEDLGTTPPPKEDPVFDLKPLPDNLKYAHIDDKKVYPVIISSKLSEIEEERLLEILKKHRGAIGYTLDDLKKISPSICQHAINMEDDAKPVVEHQRRLIPKMKEVVRNEVLKLLEAGIIYPIADSRWVSPVHCVPKKGGMTVVPNDNDELIPQRVVVGICFRSRSTMSSSGTQKDSFFEDVVLGG